MPTATECIALFREALEATPVGWSSIDLRVAAVRIQETWVCISARCILDHREVDSVRRLENLPDTSLICAIQEVMPVSNLNGVLQDVANGSLKIADRTVQIGSPKSREAFNAGLQQRPDATQDLLFVPYSFGNAFRAQVERGHDQAARIPLAHSIDLNGESCADILRCVRGGRSAVDRQLQGLIRPWAGLPDLVSSGLRSVEAVGDYNNVTFSFVAPIGVDFQVTDTMLRGRMLTIALVADSLGATRVCSVGFSGVGQNGKPISDYVPAGRKRWRRRRRQWELRTTLKVPATEKITLMLRVADEPVARMVVEKVRSTGHPLLAAHGIADVGLERWKKFLLSSDGTNAREFEGAVRSLFGFLSIPVDHSIVIRKSDTVDLTAYVPGGPVLPVECTTGPLKGDGKLAKLVQRTERLRQELRRAGYRVYEPHRISPLPSNRVRGPRGPDDIEVIGVLISALPFTALARGELNDAVSDGIAVLARNDLEWIASLPGDPLAQSRLEELVRSRALPG